MYEKDYKIYITTPLFEFWLLLHLVDIKSLSKEQLECIKVNNGVSENIHIRVSVYQTLQGTQNLLVIKCFKILFAKD